MDNPAYMEEARLWLRSEVEDRRRLDMLSAVGLVVIVALSIAGALFYLGPVHMFGGLLIMLVVYLVYRRWFHGTDSVVSAQTTQPRTLGVIRNPVLTRNFFEQSYVWIHAGVILLTAPVALARESVALLLRRNALRDLQENDAAARVLALLAEREHAWPISELVEREADALLALEEMHDLRGVIRLSDGERYALTDTVRAEIRGGEDAGHA
jgi:hypothetical protein